MKKSSKSKQTFELEPYMIGPRKVVTLPPDSPDMPRTNNDVKGKVDSKPFKPNSAGE